MTQNLPDNWDVLKFLFLGLKSTNENTKAETIPQENHPIPKETMNSLTIDPKKNCYIINPDQMNTLQQEVARSFTLDQGSFDIKIDSGCYSHANTKTEADPFVLLWIYGIDGSTFINKNTGCEVSAAWITLNGYNDRLKLDVKNKVIICALFFDINNTNNSGAINLSVTSNEPSLQPFIYTVDSKQNCYVLDENHLSTLKQANVNSIELNPGRYQVRIRKSTASRWSNDKNNQLDPWVLMLIQGGKFIPKLTGTEVEKTWCSLNGLNDQFPLEVKEPTILSGFLFDTYKEDKDGQIILTIDPVNETEWIECHNARTIINKPVTGTTNTMTEPNNPSGEITSEGCNPEEVNASQNETTIFYEQVTSTTKNMMEQNNTEIEVAYGASKAGEVNLSQYNKLHFNKVQIKDEIKKKWEEIAPTIELPKLDEQDKSQEAFYWDSLEKWLLKGSQAQTNKLTLEVERVKFITEFLLSKMEAIIQNFQNWNSGFEKYVERLIIIENEIIKMQSQIIGIDDDIDSKISQLRHEIISYIDQGDTKLYNWTFEKIAALQNCSTDRQTLVKQLETFADELKTELNNAPCVNPEKFTPWTGVEVQPQLSIGQPQKQPECG
jgi:hypothetical protein